MRTGNSSEAIELPSDEQSATNATVWPCCKRAGFNLRTGDGNSHEGDENDEQGAFVRYVEELRRKYEIPHDLDEQGAMSSGPSYKLDQPEQHPIEKAIKEDGFEIFAKIVEGKYQQEEEASKIADTHSESDSAMVLLGEETPKMIGAQEINETQPEKSPDGAPTREGVGKLGVDHDETLESTVGAKIIEENAVEYKLVKERDSESKLEAVIQKRTWESFGDEEKKEDCIRIDEGVDESENLLDPNIRSDANAQAINRKPSAKTDCAYATVNKPELADVTEENGKTSEPRLTSSRGTELLETRQRPTAEIDLRIRFYRGSGEELNRVSFSVSKHEIEIQTGLDLSTGGKYRLKGHVRELWNFDVERIITRDRYLDIYVPTRFQERFKRDENYRVVIDSIRLVEKSDKLSDADLKQDKPVTLFSGTVGQSQRITSWSRNQEGMIVPHMLKAQVSKEGKAVSFALTKSWIEKETRLTFESGRTYRISGSLGTICGFDGLLRETGYSEVHHIYVPSDQVAKFRPGRKYDVRIDEIRETSRATDNPNWKIDKFWDWKTVAAWMDTEGHYQAGKSRFRAVISQDEREPLDGMRDFLLGERIPSVVYDVGKGHYQLRTLGGMETMAKFVLNTEPFIRTRNKREQIAHFKDIVGTRARHENVHERNARRILGIGSREGAK